MAIWISSGDDFGDLKAERYIRSEEDWDVIIKTPVVDAVSMSAALAQFAYGEQHPDESTMYVAMVTGEELICGSGKYALEVTYKGALAERPYKYHIDSYAERNTYESVLLPGESLPLPADVSQPRLGLTVRYIALDRPDTSAIGTQVTPPLSAIDTPTNAFGSSTDVIVAYPDGWVLENRSGPNIPGTEAWMVEDKYVYYQPWRPRG